MKSGIPLADIKVMSEEEVLEYMLILGEMNAAQNEAMGK